jgi:hypothetical protein
VVPKKDVATAGHSLGEITVSHGRLASRAEVSAMASNERGHWAPHTGALWDAVPRGQFQECDRHGPWDLGLRDGGLGRN